MIFQGGTVDISVQEKTAGGQIKHIRRAEGGPWGGTRVDDNFFEWLSRTFGKSTIDKFKMEYMSDYFELIQEFEIKKRAELSDKRSIIIIRIPVSFVLVHQSETNRSITETLKLQGLSVKEVSFARDKLKFDKSIFESWFEEPVRLSVCHVKEILDQPKMQKVKLIILVGGFAECELLQSAFRSALRGRDVIIPEEAGVAVLKGAVEFGLKPVTIQKRIMKLTYGIAKTVDFDADRHQPSKAQKNASGKLTVQVFEVFARADDEVKTSASVTKAVVPTETLQTKLEIYCTRNPNPKYITDESCKKVGEVIVEHPDGETMFDKMFKVQFEFGETDIVVTVERLRDNKVYHATIDCL